MAKKPRKKPKYNLKSKITSALRKVWRYSPGRVEALKRALTGTYYIKVSKKGKEYKAPHYTCEKCKAVTEKAQVDHLQPVVGYEGFISWDRYISRMFVDAEFYQIICKPCHKAITLVQKDIRKKMKKVLTK